MLAHPAEGIAVQIARCADVTHHAQPSRGALLKDLPQRPAPEIHVQIVKVLDVYAVARGKSRFQEVLEDGSRTLAIFAPADPAAGAGLVGFIGGFMPVVRWITQADDYGHLGFDLQRTRVLLGNGLQVERK